MAPAQVVCLSLFVLFLHIRAEPESSDLILPGSSLYANSTNSSWPSSSGRFAFGFYPQGNNGFAVGIWLISKSNITVVWTANRDDPPVSSNSTIEFTKDDKLLLRTGQGKQNRLVELLGDNDKPAFAASMLDSGNFKIYGNNISDVIWESFYHPTDTILGGQKFPTFKVIGYHATRFYSTFLTSSKSTIDHSSGRFYLEKNPSADLVAYAVNRSDVEEDIYWTFPEEKFYFWTVLDLSPRGVLQLRSIDDNTTQIIARSSHNPVDNEAVIYRATLDADGIFRLYLHRFKITGDSNVSVEWSALQNQCEVKGICGFNSFCSTNNSKAECHCFPGFDFINPRIKSLGCYKTFNDVEGCKTKDPVVFYSMTTLENTKLGGVPYAKLSMNKEDCSNSCLSDCYCGAALYSNRTCYNFKLPLMFGTKVENESAAVFVKRSSGNTKVIRGPRRKPPNLKDRILAESKKNFIRVLGASLGSITFLCFLIAICSFLVYRHRVDRYIKLPENAKLGLMQEFTLQSFNYNELEQATDGFKEELGRGEFGAVYKGVTNEGKNIAVKRLENPVEEGDRKFRAEMAAISRTHHRNLVRLLGFCMEGSEKILVYEYMSNGSLADLLFNGERRPPWNERVKIALDVARGILYLHEEGEVQIIHCNINSRSILLDDYWTAKISNFSFAKLLMPNQTEIQAGAPGNRGYMAPEWQKNALLAVNSDVYSFGVVLLEILCCRRNLEVHVSKADEMLLSTWVYNCFIARELNKLVIDEEGVDMKTLERMVKVGLFCIQENPNLRPTMKNVILMLEGTMNVPVPPHPSPSILVI